MSLTLNIDSSKFGHHKHFGRGDKFLICHVNSNNRTRRRLYGLTGETQSVLITTLPGLLVIGPVEGEKACS